MPTEPPSLRLFVAVELEEGVRGRIGEIQGRLREVAPPATWVATDRLHLTLKFLGATAENRLAKIQRALEAVAKRHGPMEVELAGAGAFPSPRRPRVLWVGFRRGVEGLKSLAGDLDRELARIGFESEKRPFSGHVTVARIRRPASSPELERELERSADVGELVVKEFVLMKSELRPQGPRYTPLERYELSAG